VHIIWGIIFNRKNNTFTFFYYIRPGLYNPKKNNNKKNNFTIAGTCFVLIMVAFLSGCKKDNANNTVTDAQAASIVTSATASSSGGLAYDITSAVSIPSTYGYKKAGITKIDSLPCGTSQGNPINWSFTYGSYIFSYTGNSTYELLCSGVTPSSFTVSDSYNGQYSYASEFSATSSDNSNWAITNLGSNNTFYIFNGTFNQNGTYKSTSGSSTSSYTYTLAYTSTNVTVDKTTQNITGGSATIKVTASLNGGPT
jgi:hypothetical protein